MKKCFRTAAFLQLVVIGLTPVHARDFMERPRSVVFAPADRITQTATTNNVALLPAAYTEAALDYQLFRASHVDKFQIRNVAHFGIADVGAVRSSVYYSTFLFSGPVNEGDSPGAEAAQWMMNAIQFEYGLIAQYPIQNWIVMAEFGRRSYHPVRSPGFFAEPAADILRGGVAPPILPIGKVKLETLFRFSWSDIYDFWGSDLPLPRAPYVFHHAYEARYAWEAGDVSRIERFVAVMVDTNFLRAGEIDNDIGYEAGIGVSSGGGGMHELYLNGFDSADTEQIENGLSPASLLGYGIRFSYSGR